MDPFSLNYKSPPKRVVLGNLNNQNGNSPISPMANLKLLTKVATSHFLDEESTTNPIIREECEEGQTKCNRRLRSLSFICKKFLLLYELYIPGGEFKCISLGNLALVLGIEKRRVYDIINVVGSLQMAIKVCKDKYNWYGYQNLPGALYKLKRYAIQNKLHEQVRRMFHYQTLMDNTHNDHNYDFEGIPKFKIQDEMFEDNRIGILCQKFIMLFLVTNEGESLNLATVAKLILSRETRDKTGMRRLYDVANVLESLGLIKRYGKINKRPSFVYCGPKIDVNESEVISIQMRPFAPNLDLYETSSAESSSEVPGLKKLDSMLEVVCSELERYDEEPKPKRRFPLNSPQVKKALFPTPHAEEQCTFIKAPNQSFRYSFNTITEQPRNSKETSTETSDKSTISGFEANNKPVDSILEISEVSSEATADPLPKTVSNLNHINSDTVILTKVGKSVKIIKPISISNIQNVSLYKAVKNGNVMQLVKL